MISRSKPKRYIECPKCSGYIEQKIGKMKCTKFHAKFEYDDRLESIFADTLSEMQRNNENDRGMDKL